MGIEAPAEWERELASILLTEAEIQARVAQLAREIAADYGGRQPLLVGVLKGSVVFLADLIRHVAMPLQVELVCCSSYGQGTESSGQVVIKDEQCGEVAGRDVIVIEDIVDSGLTLARLVERLQERGAASVRVCCLLSKPSRRTTPVQVDYLGFEIPDEFVVGYGLDYAERFRWLPYVAVLRPEVYES